MSISIEEFAKRLWAPSPEGGLRETHWFYERARGQYANAQAKLSPSDAREFISKNPRSQMFTKTDLAKYEYTFNMLPHIVSLGAQKNFAKFASEIGNQWGKGEEQFNEFYFKKLIAKAILFRYLDKNIMAQHWYGGYKANIITYTLSKFTHMVSEIGKQLDLLKIWERQTISSSVEAQLLIIAEKINKRIKDTPEGITNVTEWCKKELCWKTIQDLRISLLEEVINELIDIDLVKDRERDARNNQKVDDGIMAQQYVLNMGAEYWKQVAHYGLKMSFLSPKEMGIIEVACEIPIKLPTEKQSKVIIEIERKAKAEGFEYKTQ